MLILLKELFDLVTCHTSHPDALYTAQQVIANLTHAQWLELLHYMQDNVPASVDRVQVAYHAILHLTDTQWLEHLRFMQSHAPASVNRLQVVYQALGQLPQAQFNQVIQQMIEAGSSPTTVDVQAALSTGDINTVTEATFTTGDFDPALPSQESAPAGMTQFDPTELGRDLSDSVMQPSSAPAGTTHFITSEPHLFNR